MKIGNLDLTPAEEVFFKDVRYIVRAVWDGVDWDDVGEKGLDFTVGLDADLDWDWQTGDNSYSGPAYSFPVWGVGTLYRDIDADASAEEIVADALENLAQFVS